MIDNQSDAKEMIAELIAKRQAHRVSQFDIAQEMGTNQTVVSRVERGEIPLSETFIAAYTAALRTILQRRSEVAAVA